jgi:hypothetical protein
VNQQILPLKQRQGFDMTVQPAIIRAEVRGTGLVVIDTSQSLPEPSMDQPLLQYLTYIAASGWIAVRGRFVGWEVILDFEQQTITPYKIPAYTTLLVSQLPTPGGISTIATLQTKMMDELQDLRVKEGWEILAGPKHFFGTNGISTVAIWLKTYCAK